MLLEKERYDVVRYGVKMLGSGLTRGTGGNLSRRSGDMFAVTPSGVDYESMRPEQVMVLGMNGDVIEGEATPSSEWFLHAALYADRPGFGAVVHTHAPFTATMACMRREIPAVHYLVGFAGKKVPLAAYATFGTPELAENVVRAMRGFNAVLMENHGLAAAGDDLERAFAVAEEVEFVAEIYYRTLCAGGPCILPDDEMERVMKKFRSYGSRNGS